MGRIKTALMVTACFLLVSCSGRNTGSSALSGFEVSEHIPLEHAEQFTADRLENGCTLVDISGEKYLIKGGKATYLTLATLKAEPNEGYEFTGWEDDGTAPAERQVLVEGDATYTAFFAPKQLTVIFMVGEDKVQEDIILYGQHVLSPAADPTKEGYTFVGWKSSVTGNVLTPAEVDAAIVTEDVTYTAEFKANPGTGIDQTLDGEGATKVLRDDHLFIERNGKTYDSTGRLVR